MAFVQILIISVTLVVVAVPEGESRFVVEALPSLIPNIGLPLTVTLALALATKCMTKENLLVRILGSCETMANVSVICTNKTGTLTQNTMSIVAGSVGVHAKFVRRLEQNQSHTNAADDGGSQRSHDSNMRPRDNFSIDLSELNTILSQLQKLFNASIAVNSTAFEDEDPDSGKLEFVGSKMETALLSFVKDLQWSNFRGVWNTAEVVQMIPLL